MNNMDLLAVELACQRLAYSFCYLSDRGMHEDYAALFAVDGVFTRPGLEARGRPAILAAIQQRPGHLKTRHLCTNVIVDVVDSRRATSTGTQLYVLHDSSTATTHSPVVVDFTDDYALTDEGWRIARRSVKPAF